MPEDGELPSLPDGAAHEKQPPDTTLEFPSSVPPELARYLKQLQNKVEITWKRVEITSEATSGHFPPPKMLEGYARLHPDAPKIFFEEYLANSQHRRELEIRTDEFRRATIAREQENQQKRHQVALYLGSALGFVALVLTSGVAYALRSATVFGLGMAAVAGIIAAVRWIDAQRARRAPPSSPAPTNSTEERPESTSEAAQLPPEQLHQEPPA